MPLASIAGLTISLVLAVLAVLPVLPVVRWVLSDLLSSRLAADSDCCADNLLR